MAGLSSAIDWWDEWKLRILVLCSLLVQFLLFFAGYVRTSYNLRRLRVLVWLAYIGGDALAVYALATLFNRQNQPTTTSSSSAALEVTWAPVLLIHLGGAMQITAYSIEDNELWKRHAVTLVSQVTVALYVFCKWWSGDKRLLQAAILLFVVGILRFSQKPRALRRASYGNMTPTMTSSSSTATYLSRSSPPAPPPPPGDDEENPAAGTTAIVVVNSLEEYVTRAQEQVKQGRKESASAQLEKLRNDDRGDISKDICRTFLELTAPYSVRLRYIQLFLNMGAEGQHMVVRSWITGQFSAFYTMSRAAFTCLGMFSYFLLPSLAFASVILFAVSDKDGHGYSKSDVTVTYVLFLGTAAMELGPLFIDFLCGLLFRCNPEITRLLRWQDMVAQHSVLSFCARRKTPPTLMKLATFTCVRDFVNKHWYIRHRRVAWEISVLVRRHALEDGWKGFIADAATYKRFSSFRGEHTLMKQRKLLQLVGWIFDRPFDEYVLLWHIATDICLFHHTSSSSNNNLTTRASSSSHQSDDDQDAMSNSASASDIISNYMIYLLFICPDMLISGTRSHLFTIACNDIERIIKDDQQQLPLLNNGRRSIAQRLLCMGQQGNQRMMRESRMISDAYTLAKALIDLKNGTEMCEVIQGVWVEMLCYSASRCRGYLHAKRLGVAPEYLTNVWLLWWGMGMQTLSDMMHNLGSPQELTTTAAASASD